MIDKIKKCAVKMKRELFVLILAVRDPRTPWYAKIMAAAVIAYALSPIDLIPDFIPILGQLDDLILVPLGILIAVKMIPRQVMAECRERARRLIFKKKPNYFVAVLIIIIWILLFALIVGKIVKIRQ